MSSKIPHVTWRMVPGSFRSATIAALVPAAK